MSVVIWRRLLKVASPRRGPGARLKGDGAFQPRLPAVPVFRGRGPTRRAGWRAPLAPAPARHAAGARGRTAAPSCLPPLLCAARVSLLRSAGLLYPRTSMREISFG